MSGAGRASALIGLLAAAGVAGAAEPASGRDDEGAALFARHCVHCHGEGDEATGTLQLARTRGADKALLAGRTDLPPEYIQFVVRNGLKAMPGFLPSEITDQQLGTLAGWLRGL